MTPRQRGLRVRNVLLIPVGVLLALAAVCVQLLPLWSLLLVACAVPLALLALLITIRLESRG